MYDIPITKTHTIFSLYEKQDNFNGGITEKENSFEKL
jgi:hypothetical protein